MKRRILLVKSKTPFFITNKFFGGVVTNYFLVLEPSILPGYKTIFIKSSSLMNLKKPSIQSVKNGVSCSLVHDFVSSGLEILWESLEMTEERWTEFAKKCKESLREEELAELTITENGTFKNNS